MTNFLTWKDSSGSAITSANVGDEVTVVLTFNDDDVSWVYIDWDDGDDNSLDNAIYQWYKLESNSNTVELNHIYTKAGTMEPIIRTINTRGFLSKYFYDSENNLPEPKQQIPSGMQALTVNDSNPIGVTRIENKQTLSGIDNSIFEEGPKDVFFYRPPILASTSSLINVEIYFEITYIDAMSQTATTNTGSKGVDSADTGVNFKVRTISNAMHNGTNSSAAAKIVSLGKVAKILEIKQKTIKRVSDTDANVNEFNKIKTFLIAQSDADDLYYPITYVSNGDPIKKSSERNVTLDFTQSRAKASNKTISNYFIDNGKIFFGPTDTRWQANNATSMNDNTKTNDSTKELSYTYMTKPNGVHDTAGSGGLYKTFNINNTAALAPSSHNQTVGSVGDANYVSRTVANQFPIDDFNRFYDQHHLVRANVKTDSSKTSTLDTYQFVYRAAPPTDSSNLFIDSNSLSAEYTSGSYYNAFEGGTQSPVDIAGWNSTVYVSQDGSTARNATEYFVLANNVKTNKIFFNTSPFAQDFTFVASGNTAKTGITVAGVYYLRTGTLIEDDRFTEYAEWVPLEFKDTTKVTREIRDAGNSKFIEYSSSFTKPGYIEFNMPKDWSKISISGLTGGLFNQVGSPAGSPQTGGMGKSINATINTTAINNGGVSPYDFQQVELQTASPNDLQTFGYSSRQIGQFQYTYQVVDGSKAGKVYWVVSGNAANNKLYLAESATNPLTGGAYSNGADLDGYMRKINAYDVFDGTFKFGVDLTSTGGSNNKGDVPDAGETNYPYTFMWNDSAEKTSLASNFVNVYPIKIVLDGGGTGNTVTHFESGTRPGAELWDILPYNQSDCETVTQKDNTAFDMSFMELTSDVSVTYAGTYYSSISKNGKVTIVRTGTPIQKITFAGNALGDEATFSFSEEYLSYNTLHKLRRMEAEGVRMMWDERQKDGTYVRFFGVIENVTERHSNQGPKASKPFTFTMIIDSICLIKADGELMSDITPLGGVSDGSTYA
tara:strand:- start:1007 stop:4009 length:3003 start_codon:yes stop_codon:yes gene_type:complete